MLLDFTGTFLPISYMFFYFVIKKDKPLETKYKWFFALWIASVLFAIYIPGKEFSHYTIQLMLPISLLTGLFFHSEFKTDRFTASIYSKKVGFALLGIIILTIQIINFNSEFIKPDHHKEAATYISEDMERDDKVFVSNYEQIIYYLLKIDSPTKFVHSNLLFTKTHQAFNINADDEIARIMNTSPRYVLTQDNNKQMKPLLSINYRLLKNFRNDQIQLYKLAD